MKSINEENPPPRWPWSSYHGSEEGHFCSSSHLQIWKPCREDDWYVGRDCLLVTLWATTRGWWWGCVKLSAASGALCTQSAKSFFTYLSFNKTLFLKEINIPLQLTWNIHNHRKKLEESKRKKRTGQFPGVERLCTHLTRSGAGYVHQSLESEPGWSKLDIQPQLPLLCQPEALEPASSWQIVGRRSAIIWIQAWRLPPPPPLPCLHS